MTGFGQVLAGAIGFAVLGSVVGAVGLSRGASGEVLAKPPGGMSADVEPPTTEISREGCVTAECHPGTKAGSALHGPLHVNACDSCHNLTDAMTHAYEPTRMGKESCLFCHDLEIPEGSMEHEPFQTGECTACHDPHGGDDQSLLRQMPYREICTSCHEDQVGGRPLIHGPASAGACGACHDPHASTNRKLLSADGREMCLRCHVTTGIEIDTLRVVHEPVKDDCQICHDPHATDNRALLKDEPIVLCESCHEDVKHTTDSATTQHGAVMTERSCLNCHDPHASDRPRLLKDDVINLCFECHDEQVEAPDGTMLLNMKEIIESGTSLHGAIAQSNCVACHQIHGGDHARLLKNEYSTDMYYPFQESIYALCFSCHDKQMVLVSQTETVTAFRNGSDNLHFLHVNKDQKGRSCRICHDTHAANRSKHIRDEIPYGSGGWMLPIAFKPTELGGQCDSGCHRSYEYNRVEPIVYPHTKVTEDRKGLDMVPGQLADPAGK